AARRARRAGCASAPGRSRPRATATAPPATRRGPSALDAEQAELAPVALELRPLAVDDVGRRVRDEALVCEHPLRARDLLSQPRALRLDVAGRLPALGPDDRREDPPLLVRAELHLHAAAAEDL